MKLHPVFPILLSLCTGCPASGDLLTMKDGQTIEGRYLGGTQHSVRFQDDHSVRIIALVDVQTLTFTRQKPVAITDGGNREVSRSHPKRHPGTVKTQIATAPIAAVSIPEGTALMVRLKNAITAMDAPGKAFTAHLASDLRVNRILVAPVGTEIAGHIVEAPKSWEPETEGELGLALTHIMVENRMRPVAASHHFEPEVKALILSIEEVERRVVTRGPELSIPAGALLEFRLVRRLQLTLTHFQLDP